MMYIRILVPSRKKRNMTTARAPSFRSPFTSPDATQTLMAYSIIIGVAMLIAMVPAIMRSTTDICFL